MFAFDVNVRRYFVVPLVLSALAGAACVAWRLREARRRRLVALHLTVEEPAGVDVLAFEAGAYTRPRGPRRKPGASSYTRKRLSLYTRPPSQLKESTFGGIR